MNKKSNNSKPTAMRVAIILVGVVGLMFIALYTDTYTPEIHDTDIRQKVAPDSYKKSNNQEVATLHSDTPRCQVCKRNDEVIPVVYGKPTKELSNKAQKGELKLAGCVITHGAAHWYCKRDGATLQNS